MVKFKNWVYYKDIQKAIQDIFSSYLKMLNPETEKKIKKLLYIYESASLSAVITNSILLVYNDYELFTDSNEEDEENMNYRDYMISRIKTELDITLNYDFFNNLENFANIITSLTTEDNLYLVYDYVSKYNNSSSFKSLTMPNSMASITSGVYDNENKNDTNGDTKTLGKNVIEQLYKMRKYYTNFLDLLANKISYLFNGVTSICI